MSLSGNLSENFLYKIINLIQQDSDFKAILMAIAEQTRDFLAVDRVKIYQFAEDGSGQVIAESISNHRLPSLLGLHFPASDIPRQTREEWLTKRQSIMIDVSDQRKSFYQSDGSQVSPSVPPVDHFRYSAVDPCHIQYLLAMGVLASLTVPIFSQDALWGLIAIHHSQPRRFCGQELENLELLSKEVTLAIAQSILTDQVRHQSYQESILAQISDLLNQSSASTDIWQQVLQISMESLKADGGQLYLAQDLTGETCQFYQVGLQPAIAFLDSHPLWKDLIQGNYPEKLGEIEDSCDQPTPKSNRQNHFLAYYAIADPALAPIAQAFAHSPIQSLLLIPLSKPQWRGCLILFRQAREYEKAWAGSINPDPRNTYPRESFDAWIETQRQVPCWSSQDLKLGQAIAIHLYTTLTQQILTALIDHQAAYDTLTQLPNWIIFNQRLTLALLDAIHQAKIVGVLVISLDRFKRINENLGHEAGNTLLKQVASRLQKRLGRYAQYNPLLSRWHGDVFILLLTNLNNTSDLEEISQNLLDSFQEFFQVENQSLYLTASIGISLAPYDGETPKFLLKCAEAALSQAKYQGKNIYQFYHPPMTPQLMDRFSLETDLRRALEQGELLIYYQPQVDLKSGQLVGLEALLRWNHSELGLVSPLDFIPLAEETGLIIEMGRWVLKTACSDYQLWQKQQKFPLVLSVNLSIRQFQYPGLIHDIFQTIEETGMNSENLELEITESWMMQDVQGAIAILDRLNKAGIKIAIDDFGTGYSSLGKLKYLPINTLKIDKSFIDDLVNEGADLAIIQCIIDLSKGLNLKVIAEGVETQEQLEKLQILGCDLGQGYWISPPIPSDEIMTFLSSHQSLTNKIQSFSPAIAIAQKEWLNRLERTNGKLHPLSFTDHLTQVANRLHFDHYLQKEWKRYQRSRAKLSLILCDVDYFKQFNDIYGHLGGDTCLQAIADALRCVIKRPTDLIARYGGEKFALILPDTDSPGALHLAQMICAGVRKLEIPHYQSPQSIVTLSLGLATVIPRAELDSDFLIASAEQALYQAKDEGRDRVCVFSVSNT